MFLPSLTAYLSSPLNVFTGEDICDRQPKALPFRSWKHPIANITGLTPQWPNYKPCQRCTCMQDMAISVILRL